MSTAEIIEAPRDAGPETLKLPLPPRSVTCKTVDQMPPDYRQFLVRTMSMQAYAERMGAIELGYWVAKAPSYKERRVLSRILSDEANHAYLLYRELDQLGVSEEEAVAIAEGRSGSGPHQASLAGPLEVGAPGNEWIDVALNNMFLDRAGKFMVGNFAESSYAPWAQACQKILRDETLHEGFGYREMRRYLKSNPDRDKAAQHVTRWFALGLNFFGPPKSSKTERLRELGLKRRDNEELRQAYRAEVMALLGRLNALDLVRLSQDSFPYA